MLVWCTSNAVNLKSISTGWRLFWLLSWYFSVRLSKFQLKNTIKQASFFCFYRAPGGCVPQPYKAYCTYPILWKFPIAPQGAPTSTNPKEDMLRIFRPEKSDGFGWVRARELGYQRPACLPLDHRSRYKAGFFTGLFIMFSAITNFYNKKTKGPTLMELFTATGKLKRFLTTRDVRCVHHG
jgi:hypothetical protein